MPLAPREIVARFRPCPHGGLDYAELKRLNIDPGRVLDFSANLSPLSCPPGIRPLVKGAALSRYPDAGSFDLKRALAQRAGLTRENVIVGNGSTELIRLAAAAYLEAGDRALVVEPTYGEYRAACELGGGQVVALTTTADDGFAIDADSVTGLMRQTRPRLIFLCNPNNPTGAYISRGQFQKILRAATDSLVVMDEAYLSFVERPWTAAGLIDDGNLLVLRSMTKDYALAGLRLGYALAGADIIAALEKVRPPWSVNAVAQRAGLAALQQGQHLEKSRRMALRGKGFLVESLTALGFCCLPSRAHFFLVKTDNAAALRRRLLGKGILVRDCASFGLPQYIRIAPGAMKQNRRLVAAMAEIAAEDRA